MKKIKVVIVAIMLLFGVFLNIHAQEYYSQRKKLTLSSEIVISISAEEKGGMYVNGRNASIYVDGVTGLTLTNQNIEMTKSGRGYKVAYRAQATGEVSASLKAEFKQEGFGFGAEVGGKIRVYKYIQGVVYFEPYMKLPNQDCDRWGNCVWSAKPIGELK